MDAPIIIVGAGMAAYSLAREFRKLDQATPLMLVAGDAGAAYAKPMLSNAFALGKDVPRIVSNDAATMATTLKAEVLTHTRVHVIDPATRTIDTDQGSFAYGKLVLALGADPIRLPLAGDGAGEVLSVNHLDDYRMLRERLEQAGPGARVAIIGAGLIGCEFAEDLAAAGYQVTLVDPNPRPLSALAAPTLSDALVRSWSGQPIGLRLGTTATSVVRGRAGLELKLADGGVVDADVVLSAVGLRPSVALAQQAGLVTRRGIVVDSLGQTSAPGVYALGDCAEYSVGGTAVVMPYVAPMMAASGASAARLAATPSAIAHRQEAVIVKTPSCKLALLPPPPGTPGAWISVADGARIVARFRDEDGVLRGFGLSQHTPALRGQLLSELGKRA
ncbi:FAD-dependent oxidoreductase [Massilia solisilvae]